MPKASYWNFANLLTLGNALCGTFSVFHSCTRDFQTASVLLLAAVVFDFLDGKTARFFSQDTLFGKGLDSLSDYVSFGIAPAAFGFSVVESHPPLLLFLFALFVCAGAWRLAYFIQWKGSHRPPGMPITMNGIIFPALYFLHGGEIFFVFAFFLSTCLMVGPIFAKGIPIS